MPLSFIANSVIIVIEVLLASIVYLHNIKGRINLIFLGLVLSVATWTVGNYLAVALFSYFWTIVTYVASVAIFYNLVFFIEAFPRQVNLPKPVKMTIHFVTAILAILLVTPNGLLIQGVKLYEGNVDVVTGPLYVVVVLYFLILLFISVFSLVKKLRHSTGTEKQQLLYITIGLTISLVIGVLANSLIPYLTGSYAVSDYGPFGATIFVALTIVAIIRYNLMNITVIATEVFAALLILILLGQVFVAEGPRQVIVSFTVLTLAAVLSYFLIRSMLREVRQKEELAVLGKQLGEVNDQLKRLDETKSEFVSIASHQLRTPLTVIKGYISMILEGSFGSVPDKHRQPLEKVYESGERLISLVENLLSVSRIESGRMKYNMALTQLADVAAKVVDELSAAAKKKQLTLKFNTPQKLPPLINLDEEKIRQVMTNLVDNSIKYTKRGTVAVSVRHEQGGVEGRFQKPCVVFSVSDTGNGVRPEDKDRLFQKFIRGQGSALIHTEGTGLGLYVGRMMVESHGGTIWVESKGEGLGSTFAFAIPLPDPPKDKSVIALEEMLG